MQEKVGSQVGYIQGDRWFEKFRFPPKGVCSETQTRLACKQTADRLRTGWGSSWRSHALFEPGASLAAYRFTCLIKPLVRKSIKFTPEIINLFNFYYIPHSRRLWFIIYYYHSTVKSFFKRKPKQKFIKNTNACFEKKKKNWKN